MSKDTKIVVTRDVDEMFVRFDLTKSSDETVLKTVQFDWSDVHVDTHEFIKLYGVTKILQDRTSQVTDPYEKFDAYVELFDETLRVGLTKRDKVKQGKRLNAVQAEALARYFSAKAGKEVPVMAVHNNWKGLKEEQKSQVLENPAVIKLITEVSKEATEQADDVDMSDLLS